MAKGKEVGHIGAPAPVTPAKVKDWLDRAVPVVGVVVEGGLVLIGGKSPLAVGKEDVIAMPLPEFLRLAGTVLANVPLAMPSIATAPALEH